uniref:Uncharacterized protein n=1 Tax=Rangifer tarandus platyrhynchus TaxID=3082113 RepID=A0ACB0EQC6_RANTA|nr:unnamed protein product [Rangifer tarandus platyrhynchus]
MAAPRTRPPARLPLRPRRVSVSSGPARFAAPPGSPQVPCSSQSPPQAAGSLLTQDPARPRAARDSACHPARILPPGPVSPRAAAAAPPRAGRGCTKSSMVVSNPPRGRSYRGDGNPRPHLGSGFRIATPRKRTPPSPAIAEKREVEGEALSMFTTPPAV